MSKIQFNHTAHKELWNWVINNPDNIKFFWPGWKHMGENGGTYDDTAGNQCFACIFTSEINKGYGSNCKYCPFGDFSKTGCLDRLYDYYDDLVYRDNKDLEKIKEVAIKIRDFPIREDFDYEKYEII